MFASLSVDLEMEVTLLEPGEHRMGFKVDREPSWFTSALFRGDIRPVPGEIVDRDIRFYLEVNGEEGLMICKIGDTIYMQDNGALSVRKKTGPKKYIFDTSEGQLEYVAALEYEALVKDYQQALEDLTEAIRLTAEYMNESLPPKEGWSWYEALKKYAPLKAAKFHLTKEKLEEPIEHTEFKSHGVTPDSIKVLELHPTGSMRTNQRPDWFKDAVEYGDISFASMYNGQERLNLKVITKYGGTHCFVGGTISIGADGMLSVRNLTEEEKAEPALNLNLVHIISCDELGMIKVDHEPEWYRQARRDLRIRVVRQTKNAGDPFTLEVVTVQGLAKARPGQAIYKDKEGGLHIRSNPKDTTDEIDYNQVKLVMTRAITGDYELNHEPDWAKEAAVKGYIQRHHEVNGTMSLRVWDIQQEVWQICNVGQTIHRDPKGVMHVIE